MSIDENENAQQPGEFDLIARLRRQVAAHPWVELGIGDDCAVLKAPGAGSLLVTTDMLMEGRHFLLDDCEAEDVGYKAMAVNLSDIAAMGGRPLAAFVAVALPRDRAAGLMEGLGRGLIGLADQFGVALAGGDTNAWDGPLVISVTLLGETGPRGAVTRSGALPGDRVIVTGPLGGSLLGRHLRPTPRISEARILVDAVEIHAMIDLSDGLASDLAHILEESGGLGAILEDVPIHDDARRAAERDGRSALDHALSDGEDFELCATLSPGDLARLRENSPSGLRIHPIGVVTQEPGIFLRTAEGGLEPLKARGFDHLKGARR